MLFVPFIIVMILVIGLGKNIKRILTLSAVFIVAFAITISPWVIRNLVKYNSLGLSTCGSYNLLYAYVGTMELTRRGETAEIIGRDLTAETESLIIKEGKNPTQLNSFQKAAYWQKLATLYISKYPLDFSKHYLMGIVHFFLTPETQYCAEILRLPHARGTFCPKNYPGPVRMIRAWLLHKSPTEMIIAFAVGLWFLISYCLLLVGLLTAWKEYDRTFLILCILMALYFAFMTGTAGDSRFRFPAVPFYLTFIGIGFDRLISRFKKGSSAPPDMKNF